ncbi:DNA-processing protein DprA [Streptomyces sp. NPDC051913]|uniref:DNA-processing protein DprA n=1 Tax=Streptomyces sp. NPDC051913 TaxID=3365676 RepID=UPI0037D6C509
MDNPARGPSASTSASAVVQSPVVVVVQQVLIVPRHPIERVRQNQRPVVVPVHAPQPGTRPLSLWVRDREQLAQLTVSTVTMTGDRALTKHAVTRAHHFAATLAEANYTISVTLAHAVDSTAQQTAIEAGRATLPPLPRALDDAPPHVHTPLLRALHERGSARQSSTGPAPQPAARR